MNLYTGPLHDIDHQLTDLGAYEWWYVDSLSPDGEWGVVLIQFRGMPMSPQYLRSQESGVRSQEGVPSRGATSIENCGYAVSVYHKGARIAFAFRGVPASRFSVPGDVWEFDTALPGQSAAIRIHAEVEPSPMQNTGAGNDPHSWVLVAPRTKARVRVELVERGLVLSEAEWSGLAYRDHNYGSNPMQADFKDWYYICEHTV